MRSFDTWNRYEDNQGNPLHGCIQFMVKDGTTVAPIYDSDGTALDNPQLTDIYGRTQHQVFIDEDCIAYFYKYIGNGIWSTQEGINTSDQTKWSLQYTIENQNSISRNISSTGTYCVSTIADLRLLDIEDVPEINGIKVITLLGYNKLGDKEPINYYWDSESIDADNEGSIIKYEYEITGRWIMVQPTHHCDSRHFGVFPSNSYNTTEQTYRLSNLFEYCNSKGISPFLDTVGDYIWYRYRNLNVASNNPIIVSKGIQFYDETDSTITGEWQGNPHFVQRNTNLIAKNVKTSWDAKSYTGYENVIIDKYTDQKNWQGAHIDTRMLIYGFNFDNCTFEENGNIGSDNNNSINNTFNNCKLTERMFVTSGDYTVSLAGLCTNCQIDMDDFRNNMWLYKMIRQTMDGDAFFDFRDMPNVGKPINNWAANKITSDVISISNLKNIIQGTRYQLDNLGGQVISYIMEDCTGYYQVQANTSLTLNNCNVKLRLANNVNLFVTNGSVEIDDYSFAGTLGTVSLNSTTITAPTTIKYKCVNLSSRDSTINMKFDVTSNGAYYNTVIAQDQECAYADVKDCNVGANFILYGITGDDIQIPVYNEMKQQTGTLHTTRYVNGTFKDNYVSGQLIFGAPGTNEHYASNWLARGLAITNNYGLSPAPIAINRGTSTHYEQYNVYTYKDNKGTFPGHHSMTLNLVEGRYQTIGSDTGDLQLCYVGKIDNWVEPHTGNTGHTDPNIYMTEFTMFTIGTIGVRLKAQTYMGSTFIPPAPETAALHREQRPVLGTTTVLDTVERTRQEHIAQAETGTPWPKSLYWIGGTTGMTWRITKWMGFMTMLGLYGGSSFQYQGPLDMDFEPISAWPDSYYLS